MSSWSSERGFAGTIRSSWTGYSGEESPLLLSPFPYTTLLIEVLQNPQESFQDKEGRDSERLVSSKHHMVIPPIISLAHASIISAISVPLRLKKILGVWSYKLLH